MVSRHHEIKLAILIIARRATLHGLEDRALSARRPGADGIQITADRGVPQDVPRYEAHEKNDEDWSGRC